MRRDRRVARRRWHDWLGERGRRDLERRVADMWRPASQHLIENDAERIDIGALIEFVATQLLRRHVLWSANRQAGAGEGQRVWIALETRLTRDAKVAQECLP